MGAEIQDGAVLVARAILNSSIWTMRSADKVLAITCIAIASWKDGKWFDGVREIPILRGQFVRSWEGLSKASGETVQTVRTSVQHLENVGFLTRKSTGRYHLFTIPKYSHYQDLSKYSDSIASKSNRIPNSPLTGTQQDVNSSLTTYKNVIREEGKKEDLCAEANASPPHHIPFELQEFELFARDSHLCKNWERLKGVWTGTYPGVNVPAEMRRAHSWQLSDPKRQKTKQARFLDSWLRRAQDGAARGPQAGAELTQEEIRRKYGIDKFISKPSA